MIILRKYRVMVSPTGKRRLLHPKIIHKWTNEQGYELDFDIFKPEHWLRFLKKFKLDGINKLPGFTNDNEQIAYEIYVWGVPLLIKEYFGKVGINDGFISLFPGYNKKGEKREIEIYGILQNFRILKDFNGKDYIKQIA